MKKYIIDGNNLIGAVKELKQLQLKDKSAARRRLVFMLGRFVADRHIQISLHFDGYESEKIIHGNINIIYSHSRKADEMIKQQIRGEKNPRNVTVVSSDREVWNYSRINSCDVKNAGEFSELLMKKPSDDEEETKIKNISKDEIEKLFE